MNKVSIHIVTFNSEKYIGDCLESVFKQTYPIEQIIVVDNSSNDHTLELVKQFHEVFLITNHENKGFAAAHNQAIQYSDSDYFLILNPDVILQPDYVRNLVLYMLSDSHIGSTTGKLLLKSSQHLIDSTGLIIKKSRRAFDRGANEPKEKWDKPAEVFGVSGAAAFYRREMVESISYDEQFFDEDFFAYKEDVDVAWRSQLLGWSSFYVPDAVAYHERGWQKGHRTKQFVFVRRHSYINRYRMMIKNESLCFFMLHLPIILLYEFTTLGYILIKEQQLLIAWKSFFKDFTKLLKKRNWMKRNRKVQYRLVYRFFQ